MPNPAVKEKKRELGRVKAELTKAEQAYGQHAHENPEQKIRTVRGFKISHAELGRKLKELRPEAYKLEKPYFVVESGELSLQGVPVPRPARSALPSEKRPWPSDSQLKASSLPAARLTTCTLSATRNAL